MKQINELPKIEVSLQKPARLTRADHIASMDLAIRAGDFRTADVHFAALVKIAISGEPPQLKVLRGGK